MIIKLFMDFIIYKYFGFSYLFLKIWLFHYYYFYKGFEVFLVLRVFSIGKTCVYFLEEGRGH